MLAFQRLLLAAVLFLARPRDTKAFAPTTKPTTPTSSPSPSPPPPTPASDTVDGDILCSFFTSLPVGSTGRSALVNWCGGKSPNGDYLRGPCSSAWRGIKCSSGRVAQISLSSAGLAGGGIPSSFGWLDALTVLDLSFNKINGPLPSQLGGLVALTTLNISSNNFSGTVSPAIGQLVRLRTLDLSNNGFRGPVPTTLWGLSSLRRLGLGGNDFAAASIPSTISALTGLQYLSFCSSNRVGAVPSSLSLLSRLSHLDLAGNSFGGRLPKVLCKLTNLVSLDLSQSSFSGSIPRECSALSGSRLQSLQLQGNKLTGTLDNLFVLSNSSTSTPFWSGLSVLDLGLNSFSGTLPASVGRLHNLVSLSLAGNKLIGSLPASLGRLTRATSMLLSDNLFSSTLPSVLGTLTRLQSLDLSFDKFTGTVPTSFCALPLSLDLAIRSPLLTCYPPCLQANALFMASAAAALSDDSGGGFDMVPCPRLFRASVTAIISGLRLAQVQGSEAVATALSRAMEAAALPGALVGPGLFFASAGAISSIFPLSMPGTASPSIQAAMLTARLLSAPAREAFVANFSAAALGAGLEARLVTVEVSIAPLPLPPSPPSASLPQPSAQPSEKGRTVYSLSAQSADAQGQKTLVTAACVAVALFLFLAALCVVRLRMGKGREERGEGPLAGRDASGAAARAQDVLVDVIPSHSL